MQQRYFIVNHFQQTIGTVERNINSMLQYQSHTRSSEARDFALLVDNNAYVQNWSMIQIFVILLTCSIQEMGVPSTLYTDKPFSKSFQCNFHCQFTQFNPIHFMFCHFPFTKTGIFCTKTIRYQYRRLWTSTNLDQQQQVNKHSSNKFNKSNKSHFAENDRERV